MWSSDGLMRPRRLSTPISMFTKILVVYKHLFIVGYETTWKVVSKAIIVAQVTLNILVIRNELIEPMCTFHNK